MEAFVIGGGLAGCEAAHQMARRGVRVTLYEMKPARRSSAHHADGLAELVCSNSLKADRLESASGLLKAEMRLMDSLIIRCADACRVPAGGALAVDREVFSRLVTEGVKNNPLIHVVEMEMDSIPDGAGIIATGPLTDGALLEAIGAITGAPLYFFDAAAPIVEADSIDMTKAFRASRYGRGEDDYINCPMERDEYYAFYEELIAARTVAVRDFEPDRLFEGCMPIEEMARRGRDTIAFGPMKPVGLTDPHTGRRPFAVLQLRQDDSAGKLYGLVGFQTRLAFPEQKRVFGMIPALANAVYARYGVMHRNSFMDAPKALTHNFRLSARDDLYAAGQLAGVEGYVESAASGLMAGVALADRLAGKTERVWPSTTMMGALAAYVIAPNKRFQPMNANFGIMQYEHVRNKKERYAAAAKASLDYIEREILADV